MLGGDAHRQQSLAAEVGEVLEREAGLAVIAHSALGEHGPHGPNPMDQFVAIDRHHDSVNGSLIDVNSVDKSS